MNRSVLTKLTAAAGAFGALAPMAAHAADYSSDYSSTGTSTAAAGGVAAVAIIFLLLYFAIIIFAIVIWIVMLIDAIKRTNWKSESDKTLWIVLIIILGAIGAIIYYFAVKRPLDKAAPAAAPVAPTTTDDTQK